MAKNSLVGLRFGRLVVQSFSHVDKHGQWCWHVLCECGTEKVVSGSNLRGTTKSCGCLKAAVTSERMSTHKQSGTRTHRIWKGIVSRCTIPSASGFHNYGGRGIRVSEQWRSFENFLRDMGVCPSSTHSIDRIDNDGDYCAENCRWATRREQSRNHRGNHMITANGETLCVKDWADRLGICEASIRGRLKRGWDPAFAVTAPKDESRKRLITRRKPAKPSQLESVLVIGRPEQCPDTA